MDAKKGTNIPTVNAAATDPAAVPGLVPAQREPGPEGAEEEAAAVETDVDTDSEDTDADAEDAEAVEESADDSSADDEKSADSEESEDAEDDAESGDGPVFEASDRRGSVTVDATGVRFTLDDTEADFGWDEIGAVEYATARFGRRLTVTVHTRRRREYPAEVTASSKAALNEWTTSLDEALDAYLDE